MRHVFTLNILFAWIVAMPFVALSQDTTQLQPQQFVDYDSPRTYELAGIVITGTNYYDKSVLMVLSGLQIGQKIRIPSEDVSKVISNLYKQKLFDDVSVRIMDIQEDKITIEIYLREKPRLSTFAIKGLRKGKANTLREELSLKAGQIITENLIKATENEIRKYYAEKGFLDTKAKITQEPDDEKKNTAKLRIYVDRGSKIKINDIIIEGNTALTDRKVRKLFKDTKPKYRFLAKSRYEEDKYQDDKQRIIEKYSALGYRDIEVVKDSVYRSSNGNVEIKIWLEEGRKYFFRNIAITGNTKYTSEELMSILKIKRGDVYDQSMLETRLRMNQAGLDISTLYMDDGYLFFNVTPVEVLVENDSIDLEIRIFEGEQARINKITVVGNTKTSDHVVLRELRTKPGQLFSRSDITRSLQSLNQLGYFNPEGLNVNPMPNPASGTVDIEYKVEEKPNDQIELSAGWGANSIIGTLGLTLNNFSTRRMFEKRGWSPVPTGDGQRVSLRAQTNGAFFQSYNASFTEPWLGGKKPVSLSVSVFHSIQSNGLNKADFGRSSLNTTGLTIGVGKRLKFPDDYFVIQYQLLLQRYFNNTNSSGQSINGFILPEGYYNSISARIILSRNSTDQPIYPSSGSNISLSGQFSPPYSLFNNKDYSTLSEAEQFEWLEFYKWKFDATWFTRLIGTKRPLVLMTRTNFGFMGRYNPNAAYTPFERFWLGGSGLIGFNLDGRELLALRGYRDNSLTPPLIVNGIARGGRFEGGLIYNRFTMELRYPISTNPQATVFPLVFFEAGKAWSEYRNFNPFNVYRSAGAGVRIFLPMFGMIGLDWGYGFDEVPFNSDVNRGNIHFLLGQQF
jgi:outer membrane protein insertion porin family